MSLLDDNFDITDIQILGDICVRIYKEYFDLNCDVVFEGIGKLKLEDIIKYPSNYALASRSDINWRDSTEYIRICRKNLRTQFWDVYHKLNIKYVLKFHENGIIR